MSVSFDIENGGSGVNMHMWSTNSGWFQLFRYENKHFLNMKNNKAIEVSGSKDEEGANVSVNDKTDKPN